MVMGVVSASSLVFVQLAGARICVCLNKSALALSAIGMLLSGCCVSPTAQKYCLPLLLLIF